MTEQNNPSEYLFHEIYYKSHGFRLRVNAQKVGQEKGWITFNIINNQIFFNNGEKYDLFEESENIWILKDNVSQGYLIDKIKELNAIEEKQNNNSEEYELVFTLLNYEQKQNYIGSLTNQKIIEVTNKYDTYDTVFEFVKENAAKAFIPNPSFKISKKNEDNYSLKITIEITNRQKKQIQFDLEVNLEQIKIQPARLKREIKLAEGYLLVQKLQQLQQQEQEQQYEPNAISEKLLQQILKEYQEAQNNHEKIVTMQKINDSQIYQPIKGDQQTTQSSSEQGSRMCTSTTQVTLSPPFLQSQFGQFQTLRQQSTIPFQQPQQVQQQSQEEITALKNQFQKDYQLIKTELEQLKNQIKNFEPIKPQMNTQNFQIANFYQATEQIYETNISDQNYSQSQFEFIVEDDEQPFSIGIIQDGDLKNQDSKVKSLQIQFPSGQLIRGAEDPINFLPRQVLRKDRVQMKVLKEKGLFMVTLNGIDIPPIRINEHLSNSHAFVIKSEYPLLDIISYDGEY